jgi:hypothetical protein
VGVCFETTEEFGVSWQKSNQVVENRNEKLLPSLSIMLSNRSSRKPLLGRHSAKSMLSNTSAPRDLITERAPCQAARSSGSDFATAIAEMGA